MNLDEARQILPLARELSGLISHEYSESYDVKAGRAEIGTIDALTGEFVPIAALLPDCSYDDRRFLASAPTLMRGLLCLLEEAFARLRAQSTQEQSETRKTTHRADASDIARDCAIHCAKPAFQTFLRERHGLAIADELRVRTRIHSLLAITSRRDLNIDPNAAARWKSLKADFYAWRNYP